MERSLKSFDYTNVSNYLKEYSMLHIEKFEVNMLQENCYVVSDETRECVIIDCGAFYPEERTAIVNYIKENNLQILGEPLPNETEQKELNLEDENFEFLYDIALSPEVNAKMSKREKKKFQKQKW